MKKNVINAVLVLGFAVSAFAFHPFSTSDASVAAVNSIEYEVDLNFGPGGTDMLYSVSTGITDILSVGFLYTDYAGPEIFSGGQLLISANLLVFSGEGLPSIALINTFSPGAADFSAVVAATYETDRLGIHLNAGYVYPSEDTTAGFAAEYSVVEGLSLLAEVYADSIIKMTGEISVTAGLKYAFNNNYSASFGAIYGAKESLNVSYTLGFIAAF